MKKAHAKARSREDKVSEDSDLRGFAPSRENSHIDDWPTAQLQEVCSFQSGGTPSKQNPEFWIGSIPWVSPKDMKKPRLRDVVDHISDAALEDGSSLVPAGSIFIVIRGMILAKDVPVALAEVPMAFNQDMKAIIPGSRVIPSFLLYALVAFKRALFQKIGRSAHGTMTLMTHDIAQFTIPVPPLSEQRRIAGVLGLVQRAVEQQERLLALVAELKQTLLHHLFTHGLRGEPQKPTDLGPIPLSWEHQPLEKTGDVIYGIQAAVAANLKPVGTKILTNKNITLDGKIDLESINYFVLKTARHHASVLKKGDLLFNWRSGSMQHVGKTAYFDLDGEFTHSSFILRIRPHDELTGKFLFHFLNYLRASGYFVKRHTFSVNAKFNKSAINALPTFIPDEDERREIVEALDAVDAKLAVHQRKHSALTSLFRTLLHQLMTAQLRVSDLDVESLLSPAVPEPNAAQP